MGQKILCVKIYYETQSFKIVQARYRRKFSWNTFLNRSQIFKLFKNFEPPGSCDDRKAMDSSSFGPPITQAEWTGVFINLHTTFNGAFK